MEKNIKEFKKQGYTLISNLFEEESIALATTYYHAKFNIIQDFRVTRGRDTPNQPGDVVGPINESYYADPLAESFLLRLLPIYQTLSEKNLVPTYSYCRYYTKGHWLTYHDDRPSCQYSCTIPIASDLKKPWDIYCNDKPISGGLNDAIFYKGCEIKHRRDVLLQDGYQVQLHLHYIDNDDTAYREYIFDKRPGIGYPIEYRQD